MLTRHIRPPGAEMAQNSPKSARVAPFYRKNPQRTGRHPTYLKTYAVQVVQGRLFGMSQSKANQWIHVLLPALLAALRGLGDAPARSLTPLAHKLAVSEGMRWTPEFGQPTEVS